jgi:hypothetical protein
VHHHGYRSTSEDAILTALKAIPNFRKIYQDMLSKATQGTGAWLLKNEMFRVWLEPNGDIKIFWGSGIRESQIYLSSAFPLTCGYSWRRKDSARVSVLHWLKIARPYFFTQIHRHREAGGPIRGICGLDLCLLRLLSLQRPRRCHGSPYPRGPGQADTRTPP